MNGCTAGQKRLMKSKDFVRSAPAAVGWGKSVILQDHGRSNRPSVTAAFRSAASIIYAAIVFNEN
jgi:hypothetical protein